MEICSERIRVKLSRPNPLQNRFKIKIYPADKYLVETKYNVNYLVTMTIDDENTDVDVISLMGELLDSVESKSKKKSMGVLPLFDHKSFIYVDFDNPIIQYSFFYEDLMEEGKLEKSILAFDLFYNGAVNALSILIMEALSLTRKAFKWEDMWLD